MLHSLHWSTYSPQKHQPLLYIDLPLNLHIVLAPTFWQFFPIYNIFFVKTSLNIDIEPDIIKIVYF